MRQRMIQTARHNVPLLGLAGVATVPHSGIAPPYSIIPAMLSTMAASVGGTMTLVLIAVKIISRQEREPCRPCDTP